MNALDLSAVRRGRTVPRPDRSPEPSPEGGGLRVRGLSARLGRSEVLTGVDLTVRPGSWSAIVGPNGAGKSTLLRAVAGLVPHEGRILLDGADVDSFGPRRRATEIGYAPQSPVLPDSLDVREYVLLGRTPHRFLLAAPGAEDRRITELALERLDLTGMAGRPLKTLSGGERQRAVLARALAQGPGLLLLDEPTSALDLGHAQKLLDLVDRLRIEEGLTVLSTLHDLTLAGQYAEHLVLLADGRVAKAGPPSEVLTEAMLARHYGARAEILTGPDGVRVLPVRAPR
ncbi:MAG: cobalamin transport system ATP-binding protein [Actinomycetota bacterium]|nr:cobalamin transport system ATP-binding protein [Actinomycetota bacterium]